jgi:hypothetical protein
VCLNLNLFGKHLLTGDYSLKYKKSRPESYAPAPDSLLDAAKKERESSTYVDPLAGTTSVAMGTGTTDLSAIGKAQTKLLGHRLDTVADSVSGQSTVNPKAYMSDMSTLQIASDSDIRFENMTIYVLYGRFSSFSFYFVMNWSWLGAYFAWKEWYLRCECRHSNVFHFTKCFSDYKKARALLNSVRETNPSHAPAWIASARLEEASFHTSLVN